ncbi:MAG: fatty acid desaturase [Anaerolineae bacterium]|nr:fatty acid desaturase [Thermoflexales bacterium]MDW8407666.1 fatty acid desaturase [Anaerolineae bacterium]
MAVNVQSQRQRKLSDYSLLSEQGRLAVERGLADAKWYLPPVPREKMQELLQRRDWPALRDTILWFALLFGSGAAGVALWGTPWAIIPFAIYGVIYASSSDSRWHESSHGTPFKTDWMNNALYEIASFMVLRESVVWRWSHARHHSDTIIVGRDAEIVRQRPLSLVGLALKFFNIPTFFKYFESIIRHAFGRVTAEERTFIPESEFGKLFLRARIYVAIYAGVIALAIGMGSILPLMFVGLPNLYGAWLMLVYGLTQHAGLAEDVLDHRLNTRTVLMNPINRYLYWNMGYHIEHHMFPMVPYYNLPKLHELVKPYMPPPYNGLIEAYREIIPTLLRVAKDPTYYLIRPVPPTPPEAHTPHTAPVITSDAAPNAEGWVDVCDLGQLLPGEALRFEHQGNSYAIYRTQIGQLFASDGKCTHGNAYLADGFLEGACIECPKHNGRFDIRTGAVLRSPPRTALKTYAAREHHGKIQVKVG